ncbi:hypothetical protein DPMN_152184 [Dreissena polymorpha]|uniref:Uncharacterized protein n=1 Tax=Dreissena polymorpha TaxID=45954 RepID=A0A9D4FJ23_DREPO|nr:hypothetical protein DPMN_152184 [Dreissena polymorpha]
MSHRRSIQSDLPFHLDHPRILRQQCRNQIPSRYRTRSPAATRTRSPAATGTRSPAATSFRSACPASSYTTLATP